MQWPVFSNSLRIGLVPLLLLCRDKHASNVRLEVGAPSSQQEVPRVGTPAPEVQRMGYTPSA
jgi:hypothetical protein